jgi:hypothetical protein
MLSAIAFVAFTAPVPAEEPKKPDLDLTLTKATAERSGRLVLIDCHVLLENNTGKELAVRSAFSSPYDAMTIVIRDARGKLIRQQGLAYHKSPFALPGRLYPIDKGENKEKLGFPVELPADVKQIRVMIYGVLPDSGHEDLLLTDVVPVTIEPGK